MGGASRSGQRRGERARVSCAGDTRRVRPLLEHVDVISNVRIASGVGTMTLHAPRIAAAARPGQFLELRVSPGAEPLLRRAFAIHRTTGDFIEILYQVVGRGTRLVARMPRGTVTDAIGPLGNGWRLPDGLARVLLVAGGLGAAPLGMLAEELSACGVAVSVALGAPTAERLLARDLFDRAARRVELATDDGSEGEHGTVMGPLERLLDPAPDLVCACGPEPMVRAVAERCAGAGVPCRVSLERLMACGIGACLSCVVRTREGLKRVCVDGPVFDAAQIVWGAPDTPPPGKGGGAV